MAPGDDGPVVEARLPGPSGRAQLPYLRRILRAPHAVLDELSQRYGPVIGLGSGPVRMAIVGDPAHLRELFATSTDSFRWNHAFNVLGFVVGSGSMIVSDGADHKRRRGAVQAAFSRRRLNGWIPMIVEQTDAQIDELVADLGAEPRRVDLYPIGRALVLRIVVRMLFGERMAARAAEIGELFQRPQDYLESPALRQVPHPIPFTARARVRQDRRALDAIIDAELAHRRSHRDVDAPDLLDALAHDASLTDAEIRDQVVTLMGAGYDTTAASLAWMLWRSALAPDVMRRLRDEADAVFGPLGADGPRRDFELLARLVFADHVMRETLRLHPPGAISPRQAVTDVRLGEHVIGKGTMVLWSAHLAGRDARAWPHPLEFDPDRFADLDAERKAVADSAWVPFGRGTRNCIGFALAQMELTLIIARTAQRLDITTTSSLVPLPKGMVVNRPTGGVPMQVAARRR